MSETRQGCAVAAGRCRAERQRCCLRSRAPSSRHLQHMPQHAVADLNAQFVVAGVAQADEVLRTADEIREGVLFVEVLACGRSGGTSA